METLRKGGNMDITRTCFNYEHMQYRVRVYDTQGICWSVSLHPTLHDAYAFIMRDMALYPGMGYKITNALGTVNLGLRA